MIDCNSYKKCFAKIRSEERRVGKECRSRCDWSSDVCSSDLINKKKFDERLSQKLKNAQ